MGMVCVEPSEWIEGTLYGGIVLLGIKVCLGEYVKELMTYCR